MRTNPKPLVVAAGEAFRELTGTKPTEPEAQDAWKVFFEAVRSIVEPTPERSDWLIACTKRWKASPGLLKARVLPALKALGNASPASVRGVLVEFDPAFGKLTDAQVDRALKARGPYKMLALLALPVRAMGVQPKARKRKSPETEEQALRRIATAFREAERKRKVRAKKNGYLRKSTKRTA